MFHLSASRSYPKTDFQTCYWQSFLLLLVFSIHCTEAAKTTFTFGYLRMAAPGLDSPNTLAGYQAMIRRANENEWYPHAHFVLNVTTIDCVTIGACRALTPSQTQQLNSFLESMRGFTAVLKPNYLVSGPISQHSLLLGKVPIIDNSELESRAFDKDFDYMIHFGHNISRISDHLFTYMQLKMNCAYTGLLHGTIVASLGDNLYNMIRHVQSLFRGAGRNIPPNFDVQAATDEELANFIMNEEPRRRCFVFFSPNAVLNTFLERLARMPGYNPRKYSYLAYPSTSADSFLFNGSTNLTSRLIFSTWSPPDVSPTLRAAFNAWSSTPIITELHAFAPSEKVPDSIELSTIQGSIVVRLAMDVVNAVATQQSSTDLLTSNDNDSSAPPTATVITVGPPIPWARIIDGFYHSAKVIDGLKFAPLVRSCPSKPQKQICFCNSLSRTSFLYEVNASTGKPRVVYDDVGAGEREVASVEFESCGYQVSSWSYPITNAVILPSSVTGKSSLRSDEIASIIQFFQTIYRALTADVNYATVKNPRAFRYTEISVDEGQLNESVFDQYLDGVSPFLILGSLAERINNSDLLTLVPSLLDIEVEDPVLVAHGPGGWRWNILQLELSLADLIHGLVAYYAEVMTDGAKNVNRKPKFTSIYAIACSAREAELISLSFASWGYDVPVENVVVSANPQTWSQQVPRWLSDATSSNPFVLAASASNQNNVILEATNTAAVANRGTLAVASSNAAIHLARQTVAFAPSDSSDVIFGSMSDEYWMYDVNDYPANIRNYVSSPRFNVAFLSISFASQLAAEVRYNFKTTAAQVVYGKGLFIAGTTAFGPFSNTSCTTAQISSNTRDRTCQCVKGARTIFIHSLRAYVGNTYSHSTGRFSWSMATCGVVYTPYVPPPDNKETLTTASIVGIAIGSSVFFIAVIGSYILGICFLGRNNRNAPKDSSKPFAIVFTDIQSSTSLWARAPAAMSESIEQHHALMRKLLKRNHGYEVKTVGDCFMVAFKDPDDAVLFSLDVQKAFNEAQWNAEINAIYTELSTEAVEAAKEKEEEEKQHEKNSTTSKENLAERNLVTASGPQHSLEMATTVNVDMITSAKKLTDDLQNMKPPSPAPQQEPSVWQGLRVRIGVNYGMGDVRKDITTQGYDYYGTVVNTAARVEGVGHGGQILVTEDAFNALSPNLLVSNKSKTVVIALGPQPLRGLDVPVKLFQLVPSELSLRVFPPLRLDIENECDEDTTTNTGTTDPTAAANDKLDAEDLVARLFASSKQYAMTSPDEVLYNYHFLSTIFSPMKDKFHNAIIMQLAETWGFGKNQVQSSISNGQANRVRFLITLTAKMTKTFAVGGRGITKVKKLTKQKDSPLHVSGEVQLATPTGSSKQKSFGFHEQYV